MLERCSLINHMNIQYDDKHRIVIIDHRIVHFSPTEYTLIRLFLIHGVVKETMLREALSLPENHETVSTKLTAKYVNRIRNKITAYGISIHRVYGYGYMLLTLSEQT